MQFVSILAISVLPGRTAEEQAFFPLLRLEILYEMRAPEWDPQPPFPRHRNRETLLFLCWHEKKLVHYGTFHPNYKTPTLPGTSTSTELCNKSICYFSGEKMSLEVERRDDRQPAKKKKKNSVPCFRAFSQTQSINACLSDEGGIWAFAVDDPEFSEASFRGLLVREMSCPMLSKSGTFRR